ncbi:MAG: 16S rRNA (cytosine(967)-C(5))-methyltransferase RsmB [Clostridia bacterium]|nr:16S rRNA (cytosine(967)-C(5))-methyltransferase RsmB [Clostridia bacterium]
MKSARSIAINTLLKVDRDGAYSNIAIDKMLENSELSSKDKALATSIVYGVLERKITLQHIIAKYSKTPLKKLKPFILICLETALYQILFMDKIPDSAAVNETVKIVRKSKFQALGGFVNAVLRSFLRDDKKIEYPTKQVEYLSVKYSVSKDIAKLFVNQYEKSAEDILSGFFALDGVSIKVNTLKISASNLKEELSKQCEVSAHPLIDDVLIVKGAGSVRNLYGFKEGYFHVQDAASAICAKIVGAIGGERVLDVCAAPGGKSFSIAENMGDSGEVLSLDLYEHKVELIKKGAERLGLNSIKAIVNDAEKYNANLGKFNKVLCDLPCSGIGILGKKPEIRYKNVAFIDNLPSLQYHLLCTSATYVEKDGLLFYSTCSLNKNENIEVVKRFLAENDDFMPYEIGKEFEKHSDDFDNTLTLFPHIHKTDGFFISAFKRVGE